jgi:hypothetical protein
LTVIRCKSIGRRLLHSNSRTDILVCPHDGDPCTPPDRQECLSYRCKQNAPCSAVYSKNNCGAKRRKSYYTSVIDLNDYSKPNNPQLPVRRRFGHFDPESGGVTPDAGLLTLTMNREP